jgi:hypothetical protein
MVADRQCHQKAVALDPVVPAAAASARLITPAKLIANVIEVVYQAADSRY